MLLQAHIFLTGFMGSGKSTHGKRLAKLCDAPFKDLDHEIAARLQKSIPEIFEQQGETYFREQESNILKALISELTTPTVISLGGGTVCFYDNLQVVKENGLLIYLETNEHALRRRLVDSRNQRPLLKGMSEEEVLEFIRKKIKEREEFYRQAHITVNGLNLTTPVLWEKIEAYFHSSDSNHS
jgi:shikimate kinase